MSTDGMFRRAQLLSNRSLHIGILLPRLDPPKCKQHCICLVRGRLAHWHCDLKHNVWQVHLQTHSARCMYVHMPSTNTQTLRNQVLLHHALLLLDRAWSCIRGVVPYIGRQKPDKNIHH
jgi:hypothetical protein